MKANVKYQILSLENTIEFVQENACHRLADLDQFTDRFAVDNVNFTKKRKAQSKSKTKSKKLNIEDHDESDDCSEEEKLGLGIASDDSDESESDIDSDEYDTNWVYWINDQNIKVF